MPLIVTVLMVVGNFVPQYPVRVFVKKIQNKMSIKI